MRTRSADDRNRLVVAYLRLAQFYAAKKSRQLGSGAIVDLGDLESAAALGLMRAVERFEPARGFKFETFAGYRIRGAIQDLLRQVDWMPRSDRARGDEAKRQKHISDLEPLEIEDCSAVRPDGRLEEDEWLLDSVPQITCEGERYLLDQYYRQGRTMGDIGADFDRSGSFVSIWHSSIRDRLRGGPMPERPRLVYPKKAPCRRRRP